MSSVLRRGLVVYFIMEGIGIHWLGGGLTLRVLIKPRMEKVKDEACGPLITEGTEDI